MMRIIVGCLPARRFSCAKRRVREVVGRGRSRARGPAQNAARLVHHRRSPAAPDPRCVRRRGGRVATPTPRPCRLGSRAAPPESGPFKLCCTRGASGARPGLGSARQTAAKLATLRQQTLPNPQPPSPPSQHRQSERQYRGQSGLQSRRRQRVFLGRSPSACRFPPPHWPAPPCRIFQLFQTKNCSPTDSQRGRSALQAVRRQLSRPRHTPPFADPVVPAGKPAPALRLVRRFPGPSRCLHARTAPLRAPTLTGLRQ